MWSIVSQLAKWFHRSAANQHASLTPAVAKTPPSIAELYDEALALHKANRNKEAKAIIGQILRIDPHHAKALALLGVLYIHLQMFAQALDVLEKSLRAEPLRETMLNQACALIGLGRLDDALVICDHVIAEKPDDADAMTNRGAILQRLGRLPESLSSYEMALVHKPALVEAQLNRALVLSQMQRFEEAESALAALAEQAPKHYLANWNWATHLLLLGNFERGWVMHEWRFRHPDFQSFAPESSKPSWRGKGELRDKTILLYFEQGYGDFIQFCRYALILESNGVNVLLLVPPLLKRLAQSLHPSIRAFEPGEELPEYDYQCPIMSLPLAFGTRLDSIPAMPAYIAADPALVETWRARLGERRRYRIGLVWSGRSTHPNDYRRSIDLSTISPMLGLDAEFHCLQKEFRPGDREALLKFERVGVWDREIRDFADTAALISLMDLVISVDTSVAHLAAAMGKPTWILLDTVPDYRWLLNRRDSPWYPNARLYRQETSGDWEAVIHRIMNTLVAKSLAGLPPKRTPSALAHRWY